MSQDEKQVSNISHFKLLKIIFRVPQNRYICLANIVFQIGSFIIFYNEYTEYKIQYYQIIWLS